MSHARISLAVAALLVGCSHDPGTRRSEPPAPPPVTASPDLPPPQPPSPAAPTRETLTADTPRTTAEGATFVAPAGWSIAAAGPAVLLESPEGDSHIALVDSHGKDADAAVADAWAAYHLFRKDAKWPLKVAVDGAPRDGWDQTRHYRYETSANERRTVLAAALRRGALWTVVIYDVADPTAEKRGGQIALIFDRLLPKDYHRESFAGKPAATLDKARLDQVAAFVQHAQEQLGIPGVSVGIVQGGKVVMQMGFGVRELGKTMPVDADSLYIIASNTKAMTTLLLARLVDDKKLTWDTPVTQLLPDFQLGDADTTRQVLVKHLVCACTGLPRQDFEWLLEFKEATPQSEMKLLATVQPTSKFGEMFQYSNLLAAAAGFVGGHVLYPKKELGAAYDEAMKARVFGPLGMKATTFDFARALKGNHASPHALDIDGKPALALMEVNYAIVPMRPAGGAWSSVKDVLRYVQLELRKGKLPGGKALLSEDAILARRAPQISIGNDVTYGMGLEVDRTWGIPVVHHGGSMIGYKSDMMWLPEHDVGAVILTNSDTGGILLGPFQRRLLEILFDGHPEAEAQLDAQAKNLQARIAAERKRLVVPADPAFADKLAARYHNDALGDVAVSRKGAVVVFDLGEWQSPVASRKNDDGTMSFVTIAPGIEGFEFVVSDKDGARSLTVRDAQHEYVFTAAE